MNDLNLHLSDNSFDNTYAGFRLESDVPGLSSTDLHYKKDEFRNFLLDSKAQGVNIVPEFDTPGHSLAFVWARQTWDATGRTVVTWMSVTQKQLNLSSPYGQNTCKRRIRSSWRIP